MAFVVLALIACAAVPVHGVARHSGGSPGIGFGPRARTPGGQSEGSALAARGLPAFRGSALRRTSAIKNMTVPSLDWRERRSRPPFGAEGGGHAHPQHPHGLGGQRRAPISGTSSMLEWPPRRWVSAARNLRDCMVRLRTQEVLSWSPWWWLPLTALVLLLLAAYTDTVGRAAARAFRSGAPKPANANASQQKSCELLTEDDIDLLEAFDDVDRGRRGFVDCAAIRTLLGNPATESDAIRAVAALTPCYGKLFYDDFVRLARRPGPLAALLAERKARRQRLLAAQSASMPGSPKHAPNHLVPRTAA